MKTYDDLTDEQKEKIRMYLEIRKMSNMRLLTIVLVSIMLYVPGIILLFANTIDLTFLGILLISMSILCVLYIVQMKEKDDKYLHLIFGFNYLMEDVFEIKKSDVESLKKTWKVMK